MYINSSSSTLGTGTFQPHIPMDLNLINYKNKYKYVDYDTSNTVKLTTEFISGTSTTGVVETLISSNKQVFSNWLTGYSTNLYNRFSNEMQSENTSYNNIFNNIVSTRSWESAINNSALQAKIAKVKNLTEKFKAAQVTLYDQEIIFPTKLYNYAADLSNGCSLTYDCSYITGTILSSGLKEITDTNWNQVVRRYGNTKSSD